MILWILSNSCQRFFRHLASIRVSNLWDFQHALQFLVYFQSHKADAYMSLDAFACKMKHVVSVTPPLGDIIYQSLGIIVYQSLGIVRKSFDT